MHQERLTEYRNGDLIFDVRDEGPIDGTPVVLLHGFPQRASSWDLVVPHLHERGARTFAPDQRGYSPRARPRSRFGYRPAALISDVVALVTAIGDGAVHLVGHDWGSGVAWGVATREPQVVASLTAVSVGHPGAFVRSMVRSSQALKSYYMAMFQLPWLPERMLSRRNGLGERLLRASGMTDNMIETYRSEIVEYGALRGGLGYYRSMFLGRPRDLSLKTAIPTTYVWSDGDTALSRKAADLTERFVTGDYRFEVMDGLSHWILEERPAELADLIADRAGLEAS